MCSSDLWWGMWLTPFLWRISRASAWSLFPVFLARDAGEYELYGGYCGGLDGCGEWVVVSEEGRVRGSWGLGRGVVSGEQRRGRSGGGAGGRDLISDGMSE